MTWFSCHKFSHCSSRSESILRWQRVVPKICKPHTLHRTHWVTQSVLHPLRKAGSVAQNSGGKPSPQVRDTWGVFHLKEKPFWQSQAQPSRLLKETVKAEVGRSAFQAITTLPVCVLSLWFSWEHGHGKNSLQGYNLFVNWVALSEREGSLHLTAGAVW